METISDRKIAGEANGIREKNIATIKLFVNLIERRDIQAFLDLFANDGVQYNYFQCGMLPPVIRGKAALSKFWTPIPEKFSEMHFPIETIYPMLDQTQYGVKYRGHTKFKDSEKHYDNEYFALFIFNEDGKIKEYHEYSNPVITARSFGMVDKLLL
jgi:hypothetical protein